MNKIPTKKSGFNPNWQIKTLNEVCDKISAGGDKPDDCTTEKTEENQIPIFSNGIKNKGLCGYTKTPTITKPALTISARGTIGFACVRYEPFFPIVRLICVIPNEKLVVLEFLCYALQYIIPQGEGTSVPQLTIPNFKKIEIPIPPLDEQKRIASALSKIDAYLENTIKLIEEKERFKRGIAKKLLTCKEGENIPESRFKGFEDEWEIVKLGDIGTITATGVDKKINDNETPIKLLNYLDVFNRNKLYEKEISYMTTATEKQLEKCNIRKGDLFITPSSEDKKGIAKSSVAMEDFKNTVYSYHIIRVRFNKEIDLKFKSYMCDTDFFHRQAYRLCDGSGQRYFIKLDNFRNMEICIPKSIKEQEKIGGYLSLLDKEIDNLKKQKELIKEMKRGAMQKLLSGEVRLSKNEFNENI
ncbi:restriction endonuclease subunit S [uncultured Brachyspira sp.]|mgnify:FL=1|uniref:restriction endonuclease subunit S n=1 Tax=uncultured Brachyspira sp. TaxID=221953 RepID=UPI002599B493|nr:restriction endonuclease subunit S [uncultured Brachyspira sp.]